MEDLRAELAGRLFQAGLHSVELMNVYLGDALGLYRALHLGGPATAAELAERAGIAERYAREWLESQAVSGILEVAAVESEPDRRRYLITEAHAEVLTDRDSPFSSAPLAKYVGAFGPILPKLLSAFRSGGGVSWQEYGPEVAEAQGDFNRPWIRSSLATSYLPAVPDIHKILSSGAARVADVGCGAGWAGIAIARGYPSVTVDGFDQDAYSIDLARKHTADAGLTGRVRHYLKDVTETVVEGEYDVVICIETVHDLPRPVEFLAGIRSMLAPDGVAIVADPKSGPFTAPGGEVERLLYAASVLCCLPVGLAQQPSAATGTMIQARTMRQFAEQAGFSRVNVLSEIDNPLTQFYRMDP